MINIYTVAFVVTSSIMSFYMWSYSIHLAVCIIILCGLVGAIYTMRRKGGISESVIDVYMMSMLLSVIFGGISYILLELSCYVYFSTFGRKIRYRGYLVPCKKNKIKHMERILCGELENELPDSFK